MRVTIASLFMSLFAVGIAQAGTYYDPSNAASTTGLTTGSDLYRTIGCPGQGLLEKNCKEETTPAPVAVVEPAPAPVVVAAPAPEPAPVVVAAPAPEPVQAKAPEYVHPLVTFCFTGKR